jgi:hypothetical protein
VKKIILFVALGVPVLVFIFLKLFGKNEFDVPVYYSQGIGRELPGCKTSTQVPYALPDSLLKAWGWTGAKATLLVLNENGITKNMARVADLFNEGDYATLKLDNPTYEVKTCVLLAGDTSSVVMVDDKKRIRGYYTPTTEKETDRLGVEIRILLKQY